MAKGLRLASLLTAAALLAAVSIPVASGASGAAVAAKKKCKVKKGAESAKRKKCRKRKKKPAPPTAASLTLSPTAKDFGMVESHLTSPPQTFTVTNTGGSPSGTLTDNTTGPEASRFVIGPDSCEGAVLVAGGSCTLDVTLSPMSQAGGMSATLNVTGSPGGAASAALSGTSFI